MSDSFEMVVDAEVTVEDAEATSEKVLDRLAALGIIARERSEDTASGDLGHRPGEAIASLYKLEQGEHPFWEFANCRVEAGIGRNFIFWAVGPAFEGLTCPGCGVTVSEPDEAFMDAVGQAIGAWCRELPEKVVTCPSCQTHYDVTEWQCRPPLGFGNLSITFWNWPPLDSNSWTVDVLGAIAAVSGHRVVHTFGRL